MKRGYLATLLLNGINYTAAWNVLKQAQGTCEEKAGHFAWLRSWTSGCTWEMDCCGSSAKDAPHVYTAGTATPWDKTKCVNHKCLIISHHQSRLHMSVKKGFPVIFHLVRKPNSTAELQIYFVHFFSFLQFSHVDIACSHIEWDFCWTLNVLSSFFPPWGLTSLQLGTQRTRCIIPSKQEVLNGESRIEW